jgi:hypothetical protein
MTPQQAIRSLRSQLYQLSVAAAEVCLHDRPDHRMSRNGQGLSALDAMTHQFMEPVEEALIVIERALALNSNPASKDGKIDPSN